MSRPLGTQARDQAERAEWFTEFAEHAFARPDFVGWDWCGWMDSWEVVQKGRQHSGVQDPFGNHYPEMVKAMKAFSIRLQGIAHGKYPASGQ